MPPAGIQTDSVLSARLQIVRIYIREDGRLVIEFKTQAKFRGEGVSPTERAVQPHVCPENASPCSREALPDPSPRVLPQGCLCWSTTACPTPGRLS